MFFFLAAMGGVTILISVLKTVFSRDRPNILEAYDGTGYSFPSGHSTAPIVFYGFIMYLLIRSKLNALAKWLFNTFLGILIILIAFSRLPLGVHYFTDVFGGLTWLISCIAILEITLWHSGRKAKKDL